MTGMRCAALLVALSTAIGCSKPAPPTIAPQSATVTSVDLQSIHLDVALSATNPNSVDLNVRDVTAHVVLDKKIDLGTVTMPDAVTLPAGKSTTIKTPLVLKWTDLGAMAQLASRNATVPFTVDGTVELGGDLLSVTVPFQLNGTVSPQQLAGTALKSLPGLPR
jgi:LEA14-like dessication related protein